MKKLLAALLSMIMAVSLSACCCVSLVKLNDKGSAYSWLSNGSDYFYNESSYDVESENQISSEIIESLPQENSQTMSQETITSSQPQNSAPEVKSPASYTMHNYYGMTINDVANIWGNDYALGKDLIAGGWAYIYYNDKDCPFIFCYQSKDIPTSCSGNERLSGIIAYPYADDDEFLVIEGLSIVSSYATVSATVGGEYWINEMDGGYSYNCSFIQNHNVSFTWTDDPVVPYEVSISFNYMY